MVLYKDLRPGNLVERGNGKIIEWDFTLPARNDNKIFSIYYSAGGKILGIDPVPITDKLLRKFSFITNPQYPKEYWIEYKEYQIQYTIGNEYLGILPPPTDGCTGGHTAYFPCKYVHQLQNIYFALTGEELNMNMTATK